MHNELASSTATSLQPEQCSVKSEELVADSVVTNEGNIRFTHIDPYLDQAGLPGADGATLTGRTFAAVRRLAHLEEGGGQAGSTTMEK